MTFAFIDAEKASFPVAVLCRLLGVSTSGFDEWKTRQADPSARARQDAVLRERGSPRRADR